MLADIRAVVFDLDGTLLDRRRSFERFVRDQRERFAHSLQTVDQDQYVQTLIERDRDGYGPRKGLFGGTIAQVEIASGLAETLLSDYRAGFPSACLLFTDAAHACVPSRIGPQARADHEWLRSNAESQAGMPGSLADV